MGVGVGLIVHRYALIIGYVILACYMYLSQVMMSYSVHMYILCVCITMTLYTVNMCIDHRGLIDISPSFN